MNKKGFTLIEVIAVVVIMGILALIVIPNTTRLLNEGKKEQMITEVGILISKAKYEYKMSNETKKEFTFEDYLKDKTDGYGDSYKVGIVKYENNKYQVDLRTANHCLSSTKDGKCEFILEENVSNAYVVEVK